MKKYIFLMIFFIFFMTACQTTGTVKLSLTDAPPVDNFEEIWVDFSSIETCYSDEETSGSAEWITITPDAGRFNLLTLNNGKLQELGATNLAPGTYNQFRINITGATVRVNGQDHEITNVASSSVKLTNAFKIENGITTEFVVDFDAAHSINKTGPTYTMTPVTRIVDIQTTGAIKGTVTPIADTTITVTVFKSGQTTSYAGTMAESTGAFLVGYLEAGTYDMQVEAIGYDVYTSSNLVVTEGNTLDLSSTPIILVASEK